MMRVEVMTMVVGKGRVKRKGKGDGKGTDEGAIATTCNSINT